MILSFMINNLKLMKQTTLRVEKEIISRQSRRKIMRGFFKFLKKIVPQNYHLQIKHRIDKQKWFDGSEKELVNLEKNEEMKVVQLPEARRN